MHCTQKHTTSLNSTLLPNPGLRLLTNVHSQLVRGMLSQRNGIWCSASSLCFIGKQAYLVLRKMPTKSVTSSWWVCHNRDHCTLMSAPNKPFLSPQTYIIHRIKISPKQRNKNCSLRWTRIGLKILAPTGVAPCIGPLCTVMWPAAC